MTAANDTRDRPTWLGIDFSGDNRIWGKGRSRSNVWLATLQGRAGALALTDVRRVQDVGGGDEPFARLAALLSIGVYSAASIDAPFSVPEHRCPPGGYQALLAQVSCWDCEGRPFATAATLLRHLLPESGPRGVKDYRATELGWGLNVRSTMWAGPRGGAAMTVACITLLSRTRRPIWPFVEAPERGFIVEAFPAAQLKTWGLPFYGYNGPKPSAREHRQRILLGLRERLKIGGHGDVLLESADALDAVLCAFAGLAVKEQALARACETSTSSEGWIAVHA
jgi:Protein of unknown function (DUF429)